MKPLTSTDPVEIGGYRLLGRLGSGGMGLVYLASTPAGRSVALKVVRSELSDDPEFRARFRQEILAARRVRGLYTAEVLDADPDGTPPWLATAYVAGPSLEQAVADHGPLPEAAVFRLVAGVAEALQAIHAAGVVHRDLKPSNVLLAPDGPRVIDFGIARALEAASLTRTGMMVGSAQFMAPEQLMEAPVSPAIDVFALGSLAAYAVLGRPPFGDGPPAAISYRVLYGPPELDGCPPQLRPMIEGCLSREATARPSLGQIISFCLEHAPADSSRPWLPPAVTATVDTRTTPQVPRTAGPGGDTGVARHGRARKRRLKSILIAGAVVAAAALTAGVVLALRPAAPPVNLIANGNFSQPACGGSGICEFFSGSTAIPHWTVGGSSVDITSANYFKPATGKASVDLSGSAPGSVTQQVATAAGGLYLLTWKMAGNLECGQAVKTMEVYWNGTLADTLEFNTSGHTTSSMGWVSRHITVAANSSVSSVEFADATPDKSRCGATLDEVSLVRS
jgi:choice-of-anchor C domain-containing protein